MKSDKKMSGRQYYSSIIIMLLFVTGAELQVNHLYTITKKCEYETRIKSGCMTLESTKKRSTVLCAVLCHKMSNTCQGIVVNEDSQCYFHTPDCSAVDENNPAPCTLTDALFRAYERFDNAVSSTPSCQNNGVYDIVTNKCQCVNGWVGDFCEDVAPSCDSLRIAGYPLGYYTVPLLLANSTPVTTMCYLAPSHTRTYISQSTGIGNYERPYVEYENGFFVSETLFWVGLLNIYELNQRGSSQLVLNVASEDASLIGFFRGVNVASDFTISYRQFVTNYQFSDNKYANVDLSACLPEGVAFSTPDTDLDTESGVNVAALAKTGWWFTTSALPCNPNGIKYESPTTKQPDRVALQGLDIHDSSLAGNDFKIMFYFLDRSTA